MRGLLTIAVLTLGAQLPDEAARPRPNVLVLLADDQAYDALGCAGHPFLATPSIDRIATDGALFTNAFVTTSLCCPSRASFLTGQWARTHGVLTNWDPLPADAVTFASVLSRAGYASGYFGKWHMDNAGGARPGFETVASYDGQGEYQSAEFWVDGAKTRVEGYVDDVATDFALRFMEAHRTGPFLAFVGFKGTHGPREPDPRFDTLYADARPPVPGNAADAPPFALREDWDNNWSGSNAPDGSRRFSRPQVERMRDYYRLVAGIDHNVGRLLDALERLELAERTIVVYASDNGFSNGAHGLFGKRTAYEESMRTVLALRVPGARAGARIDDIALNVDLAPTLLELCDVAVPEAMQGTSLTPLLLPPDDREEAPWRTDFLYEYFQDSDGTRQKYRHSVPTVLALRSAEWKLVLYPEHAESIELFDLREDRLERDNQSGAAAEQIATLRARLGELEATVGPRPASGGD